jgi:nickel-type superoxide dismutase maturation protease
MRPSLHPGDHVLLDEGAYRSALPRPGEVVVAAHPYVRDLHLVKRVQAVDDGGCTLAGDAPGLSTDSRDFGRVSLREVRGRVSARLG